MKKLFTLILSIIIALNTFTMANAAPENVG